MHLLWFDAAEDVYQSQSPPSCREYKAKPAQGEKSLSKKHVHYLYEKPGLDHHYDGTGSLSDNPAFAPMKMQRGVNDTRIPQACKIKRSQAIASLLDTIAERKRAMMNVTIVRRGDSITC